MIEASDLKASIGAGILTEAQAARLTALAHSRQGAREGLAPGDEPFELFRGFNEIFIMVGLGIISAGWFSLMGIMVAGSLDTFHTLIAAQSVVSAVLLWLLAEYFIRRRRMVGPAIMLSILFAANAAFGLTQWFAQVFMVAQQEFSSLVFPGVLTVVAILLFWFRFRVPFAMALIALGLFAVSLLAAATQSGTPPESLSDVFVFSGKGGFAWITLALGIAVFVVAMVFDGSDPHRVTRRSAQGFWLHVVAAPAIVNTVALSLLSSGIAGANGILMAFLALIAVVAVVIDRRSFLMAAIGYIVGLALTTFAGDNIAWLIFALGVFMLLLGSLWEKIRAVVLRLLPLAGLRRYLPPSV
jgi:hypothetical protein